MTKTPKLPAKAIAALSIGQTLVWAALFYSFAGLLQIWEQNPEWSKADITLAFSLAILTSAFISPVTGRIIDAGYGKWLLSLGALSGAALLAGLTSATNITYFMVIWILIGITHATCLYESCFSVVTKYAADQSRRIITYITLAAGFASPLCFLALAGLRTWFEWQISLQIFALVVALIAAPLLFLGTIWLPDAAKKEIQPTTASDRKQHLRDALNDPKFWLIGVAFTMMSLNHGMLASHIMPLLADRDLSGRNILIAASLIGPMQVFGRIVMMRLEKGRSSLWLSGVAFLGLSLASTALLAIHISLWFAFLFAALQGASYGISSILKPAITKEQLGTKSFGVISGLLAVPYLLGFAIGPYAGALLWQKNGYTLVILAAIASAILGLLAILVFPKPEQAKSETHS